MSGCRVAHEDRWGEILDRPQLDLLELRWFDSTAAMTGDDFKQALATFAEHAERARRGGALVDGTGFLMDPAHLDAEWRDANIIPCYNAAGIQRFAFHMPAGVLMIGSVPALEPPGLFPTGYFGARQQALDWLAGR